MATKRWQDWINLFLGVWLLVSPWALGYGQTTAAWNAYVLGAGIVAFAAIAAYMPRAWEEVITMLLGIWLFASPFVLGFAGMPVVARHTMVVGALVTLLAAWAVARDPAVYKYWHGGHSA